ncbi:MULTISPECIES: GNAT family N-acetyltransferase [unclassified Cyanobium]|uniref:GNAT family N-acetyltransferase n=1 Tax=Cyanobium sp. Cruz CV11-17 TaxID=2823709 RepID=UPI0021BC4051
MRPPEPLGDQHQLDGFDCGEESLNRWLRHRARHNERQGVSRPLVVCPEPSDEVIAYVCLSAGAVVLAEVPGGLRRNAPDPLPVVVLGRLAVDRRHQGRGLGHALVAEAISRSLQARQLIGARALLVHAIDEQAAAFYRSMGFRPSPISALTLLLQLGEKVEA